MTDVKKWTEELEELQMTCPECGEEMVATHANASFPCPQNKRTMKVVVKFQCVTGSHEPAK